MGLKGSQTMLEAHASRLDGWSQAPLLAGSRFIVKIYNILKIIYFIYIFTVFSAALAPKA
jgi:hypothetical protein